ncbi:hypothetical protein BD779DRAFT_1483326 [Infundibulicybe gibba]|nr:hypothetical protein BD779DRAFT_1483326 [Infundibulicybe gibba]
MAQLWLKPGWGQSRSNTMRTVQPMSQYAAPPGLQKGKHKWASNMNYALNHAAREKESMSFTGFLEDPIAHYVVLKIVDIATSERREKEQLIEEREHLARSKQEMESQLTTALTKRQISPPMGEIDECRAKKSREATPQREILPLPQLRPRSQPPRQHQQPTAGPSMTRVTSSHSDTTPRRELPLPYNEVSAPRGMGPKVPNARRNTATNPPRIEVHCMVPHSYPRGEQKLIQDPTPEEDQTTEENPLEESQPGESTDEETSEEEELECLSTPEKEMLNQSI